MTFLTDNVQRIQETLAERTGDSKTAIELYREKSATPVLEVKSPQPVRELTRTRTEHARQYRIENTQ